MTVRIGAEEEFHVLDAESGRLVPRAGLLLERLGTTGFASELQQSAVESNSEVHDTLDGLYADLSGTRRRLAATAAAEGLAVVAAGTVPLARVTPRDVTADARFRRMATNSSSAAPRCTPRARPRHRGPRHVPGVALAAAPARAVRQLPYWLGSDTGYASWRTMLWQRWPTAGPAAATGRRQYDAAVRLIGSGVISDTGMLYQDVRPPPTSARWSCRSATPAPRRDGRADRRTVPGAGARRLPPPGARRRPALRRAPQWLRAAAWRAARSGLEGPLVDPWTRRAAPAHLVLRRMLHRLRPALEASGDFGTVRDLLDEALGPGRSAGPSGDLRRHRPLPRRPRTPPG